MLVLLARIAVAVANAGLLALPALAHRGERFRPPRPRRACPQERWLLALMGVAFVLALTWVITPFLAFADRAHHPAALVGGLVAYGIGLVLLYRSHRDLASQWSITLEVRDQHTLVTHGSYGRVRHPMYLALLLFGVGQALALPNVVAGPAYLVAAALLVALRLGPEERMMMGTFGERYREYAGRTFRLVPGVW